MGCTETILSPSQKEYLIEKFGMYNLRFSWGMAEFGSLYRMGYKYCSSCVVMMSIKQIGCPICNKRFQTGRRRQRK